MSFVLMPLTFTRLSQPRTSADVLRRAELLLGGKGLRLSSQESATIRKAMDMMQGA